MQEITRFMRSIPVDPLTGAVSAEMTHKTFPAERRRAGVVSDSLIRLSAGLEEPENLIHDLCNSLDRILVKVNLYSQKSETC